MLVSLSGLPEWRLPADSWLPGHTPIQDAKWPAEGNVSADVGAGFGNDRCGGERSDAGDGGQQLALGPKRLHHVLDLGVEPGDHLLEVVEMVQMQSAHQRVVVIEAAFQRPLQVNSC